MENNLLELLKEPIDQRDQKWENSFFHSLVSSKLKVLSPDPQLGPDQWPYLMVETSEAGTEPASQIIRWLAERGIGLVVNPQKDYPDFVFTYGMLWHFKNTGLFYRELAQDPQKVADYSNQKIANAGDASEDFLPTSVRKILRDFFRDQSVLAPKILVVSMDNKQFDLCFSLESLGNPPESEHAGIAEAISWFLPPHYSIVLVSEKGLPQFFDL